MYYVRAYATSSADTVYGNEFSFTSNAATVVLPTISTTAVTSIAQTTAASGGDITSDGGATVTARGVCWSNSPDPTVALTTKTVDGTTTGTFTSSVTGLSPATVYFLRAYATNSLGTAYGNQVSFTTLAANTDSVVVTFAVDVTDFLNGGGSINQVVSIAGSFADRGGNLTNWSPATGAMTPVGNNIWARTVTFHGAPISTDSLFWKYVQGADWADGDEGNDWSDALPDCKKPGNNNDRKILLPTSGSWIVASKWGKCPTIVNGTQSVVEIDKLDVFPNPAHDFLTIFLANNADQSSFRLISAEGKTVASGQFSLGTDGSKLDVSRLPGGIYQLIYTGKTGVYRQKVSIIK